jgi:hypothetical protein
MRATRKNDTRDAHKNGVRDTQKTRDNACEQHARHTRTMNDEVGEHHVRRARTMRDDTRDKRESLTDIAFILNKY